jgi:hypothetical protein
MTEEFKDKDNSMKNPGAKDKRASLKYTEMTTPTPPY